jgi:hypothetical protein
MGFYKIDHAKKWLTMISVATVRIVTFIIPNRKRTAIGSYAAELIIQFVVGMSVITAAP